MRNLKKFLALVLAMLMILSVAMITTSAADKADYTDPANHLAGLKIMKGDENGNLMLDNNVTRYQAALFFVQALTGKTDVETWNAEKKSANFTDVNEYGTAIDYAYGIKLILGRGNGIYGPNDTITYQDLLVMAVRALGYETEDMQYPYGYILAADKLDLTDDVDLNNFKAELKRGEVAQVIWNMLNTQVAETDPLSDKILYPDEKGLTENLNSEFKIDRETLLEKAGYASDELVIEIVAFNEADEDDEDDIDTVDVTVYEADTLTGIASMEIAAADLGIDLETARQIDYCGKFFNVLIDCDAEDFEDKYDLDADEAEASIVSATKTAMTHVDNIAAANIKYDADKKTLTLGGEKFKLDESSTTTLLFARFVVDNDGNGCWAPTTGVTPATFTYTTKDGYTGDGKTYYDVDYAVFDYTAKVGGKDVDLKNVIVYVTPVAFAQYVEREVKYGGTSKDETFKLVAEYYGTSYTNLDGDKTNWIEYTLDGTKVSENTKKLTKSQGEKSLEVTVEGEAVKSGDFFLGSYNEADNVLTVYKNAGTFETGRLTAKNYSKGTVKIGGTNYEFGFEDVFGFYGMATYEDAADDALYADFIEKLEKGEDNVKYLLCDGKIVYIESYSGESTDSDSYPFVLISTDAETIADLLDLSDEKYDDALTAGWYIADNGYVAVAVMNTETGELELGYVKGIADKYDAEDDEFDKTYDLATLAKYYDLMGDDYTKAQDYKDASKILTDWTLFAEVESKDGVYTIAAPEQKVKVTVKDEETGEDKEVEDTVNIVDFWDGADLTFTDNSPKTNNIKAVSDTDVDAARVTLNDDTIIVAFDGTNLMARKGVQVAKYSLEDCIFYSADSNLIVVYTDEDLTFTEALKAKWSKGKAVSNAAEYFFVLEDDGAEYEVDDDGEYTLTVSGLFNIATLEKVDSIVMSDETNDNKMPSNVKTLINGIKQGTLLKYEDGEITIVETADYNKALEEVYEDYEAITDGFVFTDADTLYHIVGHEKDAPLGEINIKVATLNFTGLDEDDYDFGDLALNVAYGDLDDYDVSEVELINRVVGAYDLSLELVEEINEPTDGVLNQYIIDYFDADILVHADGDDFGEIGADLEHITVIPYGVASFDDDDNVLNIVIFKLVVAGVK